MLIAHFIEFSSDPACTISITSFQPFSLGKALKPLPRSAFEVRKSNDCWDHVPGTEARVRRSHSWTMFIMLTELIDFPVETYVSPTQTQCVNINYHIPEDEESQKFSDQRWERLRKYRRYYERYGVCIAQSTAAWLRRILGWHNGDTQVWLFNYRIKHDTKNAN